MELESLLRIIRWQNLLLIALTQYLIRYALFLPFHIAVSLDDFHFFLLVLATALLAGAGNIIYHFYNQGVISINDPQNPVVNKIITEKRALYWFFGLNVMGVGIGFYLANSVGFPAFSGFFILSSALLYLHASYLKKIPLIGNLTSCILVGLVFLIVAVFDLLPAITPRNIATQQVLFSIVMDYAIFAMMISLIREIVKDQMALKGDYNSGNQSLPVLLGTQRTNWLVFIAALLPLSALIYYLYNYLLENLVAALYVLFLLVAPLLFFLSRIVKAKSPKDFKQLSTLLKGILIAEILSMGIYQYILI